MEIREVGGRELHENTVIKGRWGFSTLDTVFAVS